MWNLPPSSTRLDERLNLNRGSEKLKILTIEDEPLFSEMLRRALTAEPGLDVVGVAKDGESAVEMAAKLDPDAVIMDIELPGEMDGIDAAGHRNSHPVHAQRPPLRLQSTSERNPRLALPAQTERYRHGLGVAGDSGQCGRHGGSGP